MEDANINKPKVEYEFKILYAFSIIFIVMSHCFGGGISFFEEFFPYCSFAISPFIFTSGYFYKSKYELNATEFICNKFKKFFIPLYICNSFYWVLVYILKNYGFYPYEQVNTETFFFAPITNGLHFSLLYGCWFILPLFVVHVLNVLIRKLFRVLNIEINEIVFLVVCILFGLLGVYLSNNNFDNNFWTVVKRILFFIPFFAMGTCYRKYKEYDKLNNLAYFSIILFLVLLIIYFNDGIPFLKVNLGYYGNPVFFLQGALGTLFWFRISKILVPICKNNKYINFIADNTYIIMLNQFLGYKLVGAVFALISYFTPLCQNFDIIKYKTVWDYYYLPHNLDQMMILYSLGGLLFPLFLKLGIDFVKSKMESQNS